MSDPPVLRLPALLRVLVPLQLAAEGLVLGLDWLNDGAVGLLMPGLAGAVVAGCFGYRLRSRQACSRALLSRLGLGSGLLHVPIGGVSYAVVWLQASGPREFGVAALPLAAAGVGLLVGGVTFLGAICALDLGVHSAGGVEPEEPRHRSFREPPG